MELSGSALLKLKKDTKGQHKDWGEIEYLCGYPDVCKDNGFLGKLLSKLSLPQKHCRIQLQDLPDKDEWTYLNTQEDIKHFMESFEGFHDSTLESLHYYEDDYGGGYADGLLYAAVAAGLGHDSNDPYSPYIEQYKAAQGEELTDPNHGKVFAVAPTDATTSASKIAMPWKADIFWQTEDPMKTKWNFEHDWYLVSWPANPLRVVVAPAGAPKGCPVVVPTNYVASATGFKMPADVSASYDATKGELALSGGDGGKVLVKLMNESGKGCQSYLPVELTDYRKSSVATPWTFEWPVGIELTPRIGVEAGQAARAICQARQPAFSFSGRTSTSHPRRMRRAFTVTSSGSPGPSPTP